MAAEAELPRVEQHNQSADNGKGVLKLETSNTNS
jgi:hypothetical protein